MGKILHDPSPAYQELFEAEKSYVLNNVPTNSRVLDVGCGDGRNIQTILQKTKNIIGIDTDKYIIKEVQEKFKNINTIEIKEGDASKIPLDSSSVDVITLLVVLMNLDQSKQLFFNEAARVLKKDGVLIVSTYSEHAFDERMHAYTKVGVPIISIEGTKFILIKV